MVMDSKLEQLTTGLLIIVVVLQNDSEVSDLQPKKASSPIVITLWGISKVVKLSQPAKARSPILVIPSGNSTEGKL